MKLLKRRSGLPVRRLFATTRSSSLSIAATNRSRNTVSIRWVNREVSGWECQRFTFDFNPTANISKEPNERVLLDLIPALAERVGKAPNTPRRLTEQEQREILARYKQGEPPANIAHAYKAEIEQIKQIGRRS
jgi:hypothetical protein